MMMLGVSLVLAGVAGLYWYWFRRRGTAPHCARCGFDLSGHDDGKRCPECGRSTAGRGTTRGARTRHRGAAVLCGAVIVIGAISFTAGRIATHHGEWWREHAPAWWLRYVELELGEPAHQQRVIVEFAARHANGELSDAAYADAVTHAITLLQNGMAAGRHDLTAIVIDAGAAGVIELESMIEFIRTADEAQLGAFVVALEARRIDRVLLNRTATALLDDWRAQPGRWTLVHGAIVLHAWDTGVIGDDVMSSFLAAASATEYSDLCTLLARRPIGDDEQRMLSEAAVRRLETANQADRIGVSALLMQQWRWGALTNEEKGRTITALLDDAWSLVPSPIYGGLFLQSKITTPAASSDRVLGLVFTPQIRVHLVAEVSGAIRVDGRPVESASPRRLRFPLRAFDPGHSLSESRRLLETMAAGEHTIEVTFDVGWHESAGDGTFTALEQRSVTLRTAVIVPPLDASESEDVPVEVPETIEAARRVIEQSIQADPVAIRTRGDGLVELSFTVHCRQRPVRFRLGGAIDERAFGLDPNAVMESRRVSAVSDRVRGRMTTFTFVGRRLGLEESCTALLPIEHISAGPLRNAVLDEPIEITFPDE